MSESSMWGRVRRALKSLDPIRIENRLERGTPDVNLASGEWIELKWCRKAPKRGGILTIDHYTTDQKVWAIRRIHSGGKVFLLLKVSTEWLLFRGDVAAEYLNQSTLEQLREKAVKTWKAKLDDQELKTTLTKN